MKHYILNGHEVEVCDLMTWAKWFETADRIVAKSTVGDAEISTVFLGLDHNFSGVGEPLIFETMVFGGELDGEQERCKTWDQAEQQHLAMMQRVRAGK